MTKSYWRAIGTAPDVIKGWEREIRPAVVGGRSWRKIKPFLLFVPISDPLLKLHKYQLKFLLQPL